MRGHEAWHCRLEARLRGRSLPQLRVDGELWSAMALWEGSCRWIARFRAAGLVAGDRVLLVVDHAPHFVEVLVAGLCEGVTLVPADSRHNLAALAEVVDARLVVEAPTAQPDPPPRPRTPHGPATPDVRFLLRTSGSTGASRWVALGDAGVLSVLASHAAPLALDDARVLSVLPWHHAFGLVLDLLASLLAGAEVIRDPGAGGDPARLLERADQTGATHLNAVPLTIQRLAATSGGRALLARLHGGVVGGAPVRGEVLAALAGTRLRVGYGQTEASPGICLGDPGAWRDGTLGRPLGCEVRMGADGELWFRGANACVGEWRDGGLERLDPARWVATGDRVREEADGTLTFVGRTGATFKLANGRLVDAAAVEASLRSLVAGAAEAAVGTVDGTSLDIWLALDAAAPDPRAAAAAALGALARVPHRVHRIAPAAWPRTPKGETDRRGLVAAG